MNGNSATGMSTGGNMSITVTHGNVEINTGAKRSDGDLLAASGGNYAESTTTPVEPPFFVSENGQRVIELVAKKSINVAKFLQKNQVYLCNNTTNADALLRSLFSLEVLSASLVEEYSRAPNEAVCMQKIYKMVGQKEAMAALVKGLEDSDNGHVVKKLKDWLEQF